jgi:hypothetical protein
LVPFKISRANRKPHSLAEALEAHERSFGRNDVPAMFFALLMLANFVLATKLTFTAAA